MFTNCRATLTIAVVNIPRLSIGQIEKARRETDGR
jgi:hypothetical protein